MRAVRQAELGCADAVEVETPADTLRRRLLLDQRLPRTGGASLGIRDLPDSAYWSGAAHLAPSAATLPVQTAGVLRIGLVDAQQIGARNSRDYQRAKERLFRAALALDLEQNEFRTTFSGLLSGAVQSDGSGASDDTDAADDARAESAVASAVAGGARRFESGVRVVSHIAVDLACLLTQEHASSLGLLADASISVPLLRGAGARVAAAPLRQAEQNLVNEVWAFEQFRREFAVRIAAEYLGVLQSDGLVANIEENHRALSSAAARAGRLADAGRIPRYQHERALQDMLQARTRLLQAQKTQAAGLDDLKLSLGLPADARIALDPSELARLRGETNSLAAAVSGEGPSAPGFGVVLGIADPEADRAIGVALAARPELRIAAGRVLQAERSVYVAADALGADVTVLGSGVLGARRLTALSASEPDADLAMRRSVASGLLTINLPFERTAERSAYRRSLLDLEGAVRDYQEAEDRVKLSVRNALRELRRSRRMVAVQAQAVAVATARVRGTELFLQSGRVTINEALDARESLLGAQNDFTGAVVSRRMAELALQRDLGTLRVTADGLWQETPLEKGTP